MSKKIHDPLHYLNENNLEWDVYQYEYSFSLKDKVYASTIRDRSIKRLSLNSASTEPFNTKLAGDIQKENRIVCDNISEKVKKELSLHLSRILRTPINRVTIKIPERGYDDLWINYQYPTEYNPSHNHSGLFSFVIYANIPESIREEHKQSYGNSQTRGLIQFHSEFTNESMSFNPSEDTIFIFESSHIHQVYPFYSDNTRITIAGNIYSWD